MNALGKLIELVLWRLFVAITAFSDRRQGRADVPVKLDADAPINDVKSGDGNAAYTWIFCSTIGELNACKPLIETIAQSSRLVLLTDRDCYREAFQQHFPQAAYVRVQGGRGEPQALTQMFPPISVYVCEIPCFPNDAPCRFSYAMLRAAKRVGAKLYLVNGWVYGYAPACRADAIERSWFSRYYLRLFDKMMVQTEGVKTQLVGMGAKAETVFVTGNMKFDAMSDKPSVRDDTGRALVEHLRQQSAPVIVAGCLAEIWEYEMILQAYLALATEIPDIKLVMAPRHPENSEQMAALDGLLSGSTVDFVFRQAVQGSAMPSFQVLVLDTVGELKAFYAAATVSYVGRDHNVLEPLAFGVPVVVIAGWNSTYPSYPVYEITKGNALIHEVEGPQCLVGELRNQLTHESDRQEVWSRLSALRGALKKNLQLLGKD